MKRSLCLTVAVASLAAGSVFAEVNSPSAFWLIKINKPEGEWWFASPANWTVTSDGKTVRPGATFPEFHDQVLMGDSTTGATMVYLKDGDIVTNLYALSVQHGHSGGPFTLEIRKGAYVSETFISGKNENYTHTLIGGDAGKTEGRLLVKGGTLVSSSITCGGGTRTQSQPGVGWLVISDGGVVTNNGALTLSGGSAGSRLILQDSNYVGNRSYEMTFGSNSDTASWTTPVVGTNSFLTTGGFIVNGTADMEFVGSHVAFGHKDWSCQTPLFRMAGNASQTNRVRLLNSSLVVYDLGSDSANSGRFWSRWAKMRFASKGYSEFVQENSSVTNCGIWFWPTDNAGNVYPVKPPRYVVKGGELYIHNLANYGDGLKGYSNGVATHGFCAFTNAPNSGTISLVDAPKVSYPRVNTDVLVSGMGQDANPRVFGHTDYRPHFEFVLTKKGHRPMEIREQTDILGMFSVVPQGGLQVVQTNRLALIRHKTKTSTLATLDEPQFRAPNADLWTTGGFADTPCEWGVTLKPEAEIALGTDLGDGVASGFVRLPRCNPEKLRWARLRLRLAPGAKTVEEAVADLNAAGYPTTLEGADEAVVDLMASGMLAKGAANTVLLDFNAPQDAVGVRDNVKTANVRILGATTDIVGQGLSIILR